MYEYAKKLSAMIQVPTISLRGNTDLSNFYKLHEVMKNNFPLIFSKLECTEIDGNLIFRWPGKDPKRNGILLMGHQDVVTADEPNWEREPFSGEIAGGNIHGRGSMDCKSTVFSEFQAIEELLAEGYEPPCDIYLATAVDEEISGGGAIDAAKYLKEKGIRLNAVLDEGGAVIGNVFPGLSKPCAAVGIVEKGFCNIKFTARGKGGHASQPPKHTALGVLAKAIRASTGS